MSDPDHLKKLAWLIADPDQVDGVDVDDIPVLIGVMESVKIRLEKRYLATQAPTVEPVVDKVADNYLTAQEAADRIGVTRKWIYDHSGLPFVKKLSDRTYRISERGLTRWLERRAS